MEIPDLLETMRQEARQDHLTLVKKVDDGFRLATERASSIAEQLNDHEKADLEVQAEFAQQLQPVLALARNARWLLATIIAAFVMAGVAAAWDLTVNHLKTKTEVSDGHSR